MYVEMRHAALAPEATFRIIADSYNCAAPALDGGVLLLEAAVLPTQPSNEPPPPLLGIRDVCPCWQAQIFQLVSGDILESIHFFVQFF
jgi:hypothetical protein